MAEERVSGLVNDSSDAGLLSSRNILVAAIVTSLGGSGTALIQSSKEDRWTGEQQSQYEKAHEAQHKSDRQLVLSEYAALAERTARNEVSINAHQDGHPDRVEALVERLVVRVEKLENGLRELERQVDRRHGGINGE